jgi:hypothetical protein
MASSQSHRLLIRNDLAVWSWAFAAIFMAGVLALSYLLLRDGPPPGFEPGLALLLAAAFWAFGLGSCAHVIGRKRVRVELLADARVRVTLIQPFRRIQHTLAASKLAPVEVHGSTDDENSPYFRALLQLPSGDQIAIAEGHDRDRCAAVCARFNAAIGPSAQAHA